MSWYSAAAEGGSTALTCRPAWFPARSTRRCTGLGVSTPARRHGEVISRACSTVCASPWTPIACCSASTCATPRELFDVIDHERTGAITRNELENALERFGLGLSMHQTEAVLHAVDSDHSDTIEILEFLLHLRPTPHIGSQNTQKKHETLHQQEGHAVGLDVEAVASHFAPNEGGKAAKKVRRGERTTTKLEKRPRGMSQAPENELVRSTGKIGESSSLRSRYHTNQTEAGSTGAPVCGDKDGEASTKCRQSGGEDRAESVSVIMDDSWSN